MHLSKAGNKAGGQDAMSHRQDSMRGWMGPWHEDATRHLLDLALEGSNATYWAIGLLSWAVRCCQT